MKVFTPYPTLFPVDAGLELVNVIERKSTLSLAEQVNAAEAVQLYAAGQILPVTGAAPPAPPPAPKPPMQAADLAQFLTAHCGLTQPQRDHAAASVNWAAVLAAVIALIQALAAGGA